MHQKSTVADRMRLPVTLAALIVLSLCTYGSAVLGQSDASLVGQQLAQEGSSHNSVRDHLLGLISDIEVPQIQSVTVIDASPGVLQLSVRVANLDNHDLVASLLRDDGRIETRIDDGTVTTTDGEAIELRFALPDHLPEGTELSTLFVAFRLEKFGRSIPGMEWRFGLNKTWSVPISPENVVVQITPVPIGSARNLPAQLGARPSLPRPQLRPLQREALKSRFQLQPVIPGRPTSRLEQGAQGPTAGASLQASREIRQPGHTSTTREGVQMRVAEPADRRLIAAAQFSDRQRSVLQATDTVVAKLPALEVSNLVLGIPPEDEERGALGPSSETIDLLSAIHAEVDLPVNEFLGVRRQVHLDRNPDSGVLYYVPRAYNLRWDRDEGYGMRMLYAAVTEGMPGRILMSLRLHSGVSTREDRLVNKLAKAQAASNPQLKVDRVRPLPLTSQHPGVSLTDSLNSHFDIPADDVVATVVSDALEEMNVSWITDEVTKANIELVLSHGIGIAGDVTYELASKEDQAGSINIPATIRLADRGTFGELTWERNGEWRNATPYPLRLRRLHALVIDDNDPIIYSWNLDAEVPPRARVEWDADDVPSWIDGKAERLWIEYAVLGDCDPCNREVMRAITYGASRAAERQDIIFRTLTPLADIGAAALSVHVRSRYFDSRGESISRLAPVNVHQDSQDYTAGSVYLVDRQPGEERPGDPLFEYQIEVIKPDGTAHRPPADQWISSQSNLVYVGCVQVTQSLGHDLCHATGGDL